MTSQIIIGICILFLVAYIYDITSAKSKIPSVIMLLLTGFVVKQLLHFFEIPLPHILQFLPVLGTVGLILIVLEGSLELEIGRSKYKMIGKSFLQAAVPFALFVLMFGFILNFFFGVSARASLINSIPFAVISSSIAIPTVKNLQPNIKEFITYESSFSDIIGVLVFNIMTQYENLNNAALKGIVIDFTMIFVLIIISTLILVFLIGKIDHHIKFAPIIIIILMIYYISKLLHLPGLLFILTLGISLSNLSKVSQYTWIKKLRPEILKKEVHRLHEIVIEAAFLIRALFFILFGFMINISDIFNSQSFFWTTIILGLIFLLRFVSIIWLKIKINPVAFIAPRGLITILLYLSIPASLQIEYLNHSVLIQVIICSAIIMMFSMFSNHTTKTT